MSNANAARRLAVSCDCILICGGDRGGNASRNLPFGRLASGFAAGQPPKNGFLEGLRPSKPPENHRPRKPIIYRSVTGPGGGSLAGNESSSTLSYASSSPAGSA